jgi:hypothetical protein
MKRAWWLALSLALAAALGVQAAEISVYPGAQVEKEEMKSLETALAKLPVKVRQSIGTSQIYTTADGFDPVYSYYKKRYPETDLDQKRTKAKISTGQVVSDAYFCLDGAKSIRESKHYLKIQSPRAMEIKPGPQGQVLPAPPARTLIQFTDKS